MKTNHRLLFINGLILLTATVALGQQNLATNLSENVAVNNATSLATNVAPSAPTNAPVVTAIPERGQPLLSPEEKDLLKFTSDQQPKLKTIEDDFAKTRQEFITANQARIDGANDAFAQALISKDESRIQLANTQLEMAWAGMKPERIAAMNRIKALLTPDQLKVFDEQLNLARE
jgi:hypothetical protein